MTDECRWVHVIPKLLAEQKLEVIAEDLFENPDHLVQVSSQTMYIGHLEFYRGNPEMDKHAEEVLKEFKAGAAVEVTWGCVVGRKTS